MHIVDITLFHTAQSGGVRSYLNAKQSFLRKLNGVRHTIVAPATRRQLGNGVITLPALSLPFGNGFRFPLHKKPWVELLYKLRPDIIEVGDPSRLAWAALEAGQRLGVPVIGFYHADLPRLLRARFGSWSLPGVDSYLRRIYNRFAMVLAPNQNMAQQLRDIGVEQVAVQPLSVDMEQFNPRRRDPKIKTKLGIAPDSKLMIFASRTTPEKNIPLLLATLKQLGEGYHLLLVGPGMPQEGLPENVTVIPYFVDTDELARLLASADSMIHTGHRHSSGQVLYEAMASGLPVIGVNGSAVGELVTGEIGVLAAERTPASLALACRTLFASDHRAIGVNARSHMRKGGGWDNVFRNLLQRYGEAPRYAGLPIQEAVRA
jgi:alpha-1,6-mannosyltransferase